MIKNKPAGAIAFLGGLVLAGNVLIKCTLENTLDDGVLPDVNITSKILGVKLEHECFPLYQTRVSNYNEGTCDESGFISGSWCCYSELTATGGKIQRDRDLAVKLGNHELEIGLGLVAVGLAFYSISGKNNKYF